MTEFSVVRKEEVAKLEKRERKTERTLLKEEKQRLGEIRKSERQARREQLKAEREVERSAISLRHKEKLLTVASKISEAGLKIDFDLPTFFIVLLLGALGLVFIYSASSYSAEIQFGDSFKYLKTQAIAMSAGIVVMMVLTYIDVKWLIKWRYVVLVVSLVLLALVFVPVLGVESYGAKRWINLGFSTVQPSEFAKFGLVIFIAGSMTVYGADKFHTMLIPLMAGGAMCLLLMLEPNMSITVCTLAVVVAMLFLGGAKISHLLLVIIPSAVFGVVLILIEPYRLSRLMAFLDPFASPLGEGYQLIQSYYSLGSGGLFGVGLFQSRQKYLFLPFAESDFIFSIIGEETGLIGCIFVIALFILLLSRGILIAMRAKDRFSCYLASGISAMIAFQTVINIAVVSGAIPPTGLPLPFMSAGGSSVVAYYMASGLLLSVSRKKHGNFLSSIEYSKF